MPAPLKAAKAQDLLGSCAEGLCGGAGRPLPPGRGHGRFGEGVPETLGPAEECGPVVDRLVLGEVELPKDMALAALAFAIVAKLERPRHSGLRSVCLLLHRQGSSLSAEVGVAAEADDLDAGCSAEASALSRLLLRQGGRSPLQGVERLVLASDARGYSGPAPAARQLLAEHLDLGTPIVCAWRGGATGQELRFATHKLSALCPHPSTYRHVPAAELSAFAESLAARCEEVPPQARAAFQTAKQAAEAAAPSPPADGAANAPPPPRPPLAAAAVLQGGQVVVCCLEEPPFPGTVVRLAGELAAQAASSTCPPELLLVCDRWGVLHAPSQQGRSCFCLKGFGSTEVLFHDPETGGLVQLPVSELLGLNVAAAAEAAAEGASGTGGARSEGAAGVGGSGAGEARASEP